LRCFERPVLALGDAGAQEGSFLRPWLSGDRLRQHRSFLGSLRPFRRDLRALFEHELRDQEFSIREVTDGLVPLKGFHGQELEDETVGPLRLTQDRAE
jgi:hypothetical protein